jgi:hypothetical protein
MTDRRERLVVRGADLALWPGEMVRLVGENGSGESTLMKIVVEAQATDARTVARSGRLGYCAQEPVVYERLTCDEHLEPFGRAYGMTDQLSAGTLAKLNLGLALLAVTATVFDVRQWGLCRRERARRPNLWAGRRHARPDPRASQWSVHRVPDPGPRYRPKPHAPHLATRVGAPAHRYVVAGGASGRGDLLFRPAVQPGGHPPSGGLRCPTARL